MLFKPSSDGVGKKVGQSKLVPGSQVDSCAGSRILELILWASVLLWGYTSSRPWRRQLASISAWSGPTLGSEGARVLCMHPLKLALYIQSSMKGLAKVRRPHRLPGMMMASSSVTCWRAADSLYFCNKRPCSGDGSRFDFFFFLKIGFLYVAVLELAV